MSENLKETMLKDASEALRPFAEIDINTAPFSGNKHTVSETHTATPPISTKEGLLEACYDVFGASRNKEGLTHMHKDSKGYPTIGAGHLVYKTGDDKATARAKYIKDMEVIGISKEQAGRDFDAATRSDTITTMRNGANVIVYPREITISEAQAKKLFYKDAASNYERTLKKFPNLHSYPAEVQVALVRTTYHGLINQVKQSNDMRVIVKSMADAWCNEARARKGKVEVEVKRGTQIAAACIAAGVEMPPLIAQAWNDKNGQNHYKKYIKPMIEKAQIKGYDTQTNGRRLAQNNGHSR